jgi:hypothetical protein
MQNFDKTMKYSYSKSLGLCEHENSTDSFTFDTKEDALIDFYIKEREKLTSKINKYNTALLFLTNKIHELDKNFEGLKKMYPEKFI